MKSYIYKDCIEYYRLKFVVNVMMFKQHTHSDTKTLDQLFTELTKYHNSAGSVTSIFYFIISKSAICISYTGW